MKKYMLIFFCIKLLSRRWLAIKKIIDTLLFVEKLKKTS